MLYCLNGTHSQCGGGMGGWRFGNTINGAWAEYLLVPDARANMAPIPDGLTDEDVMLCPTSSRPAGCSGQDRERRARQNGLRRAEMQPLSRGGRQGQQAESARWRRRQAVGRRHPQVDHDAEGDGSDAAGQAKISMKAYPNLKPEDLDALVAYVQSLKKSLAARWSSA
jgi:hypothetical protein